MAGPGSDFSEVPATGCESAALELQQLPHVFSRAERQRLADIQAAIDAIRSHLQRGELSDGLIFDASRYGCWK